MFQLHAKADRFITANGREAKEGEVKGFEDMIFHAITLVLFCFFLMEMKAVDFYGKKRCFSQSVIKKEVCVGAAADIFLLSSGEYGKLVGRKYFSQRDVRNRAERQIGELAQEIFDEAVYQIFGSELRDFRVTG